MILTPVHALFYAYHRTPLVIRERCRMRESVSVHEVVNAHAGIKNSEIGVNALHLVRMRRKNGDNPVRALMAGEWDKANCPVRYWKLTRWTRNLVKSRRARGVSLLTGKELVRL